MTRFERKLTLVRYERDLALKAAEDARTQVNTSVSEDRRRAAEDEGRRMKESEGMRWERTEAEIRDHAVSDFLKSSRGDLVRDEAWRIGLLDYRDAILNYYPEIEARLLDRHFPMLFQNVETIEKLPILKQQDVLEPLGA